MCVDLDTSASPLAHDTEFTVISASVQGLKSRKALEQGLQSSSAPSDAVASAVQEANEATTISGKRQERIEMTAEQLQGKDWALEDLQVLRHPLRLLGGNAGCWRHSSHATYEPVHVRSFRAKQSRTSSRECRGARSGCTGRYRHCICTDCATAPWKQVQLAALPSAKTCKRVSYTWRRTSCGCTTRRTQRCMSCPGATRSSSGAAPWASRRCRRFRMRGFKRRSRRRGYRIALLRPSGTMFRTFNIPAIKHRRTGTR